MIDKTYFCHCRDQCRGDTKAGDIKNEESKDVIGKLNDIKKISTYCTTGKLDGIKLEPFNNRERAGYHCCLNFSGDLKVSFSAVSFRG
jgi:hypothetical protein